MAHIALLVIVLSVTQFISLLFARSPVIIDADVGTDFDDIVGIGYAISRDDTFDIKLLLMASFNTTGRAQLMAQFLHYINRTDIDIGIGIHTPNYRNLYMGVGAQMHWADNYNLYDYSGNIYDDGISRAKEILHTGTADNPIYFISIGPYTNLAQILFDEPNLKQNMRLITMGGAIYRGYGTNYSVPEYNIFENGTASQMVWNNTDQIPFAYNICVAPLDTTYFVQLYGANYQKLLNSDTLLPKIMLENYNIWYENGGYEFGAYRTFNPLNATSCLYDVQAVFMAAILSEYSILYGHGQQIECNDTFMPFMQMIGFKVVVEVIDGEFYTVIDSDINSTIQMVDIAISWEENDFNGTYKLGTMIVDSLIVDKIVDDGNKIEYWIIIAAAIVIGVFICVGIFMYCKVSKRRQELNQDNFFVHERFGNEMDKEQVSDTNYDSLQKLNRL